MTQGQPSRLTLGSTRTPPALSSILSQLPAFSASLSASVQAVPVSRVRQALTAFFAMAWAALILRLGDLVVPLDFISVQGQGPSVQAVRACFVLLGSFAGQFFAIQLGSLVYKRRGYA